MKHISFKQLVSIFEQKEIELTKVPKYLVEQYGYACLANSLMFKEPEIPKYNLKICEFLKNTTFKTLKSLVLYIKSLQNDIDKLFAIFSWAALNIKYDTESFFSNNHKSTSLEEVFETKKAICSGYSLFYQEMAKLVGIDTKRIIIKDYSNFSKGYGYEPLIQLANVKSDHSSIYIEIDGVPFISEPTWAAGHITKNDEFEWNFQPNLFLIPLYKSLCNHFPCDESQKLLKFNFSLSDFQKCVEIHPFKRCLKTESHPFVNIECPTGFLEQTFSCIGPVDRVSYRIYLRDEEGKFNEMPTNGITSYEVIQASLQRQHERCRFKSYISFQKEGLYKAQMFIDGEESAEYFVNCLKKCTRSVPLVYNPFHDSKFIAIKPKTIHSVAKSGVLIRFAVSKFRSSILCTITKLNDEGSFSEEGEQIDSKYAQYIKLEIPFDEERYEDQLCVTFPSNGRYCVVVYLQNDRGSFTSYARYYFDVSGDKSGPLPKANPVYYLSKGRKFAPVKIMNNGKEVFVNPRESCHLVRERNQKLQFETESLNDTLYFELRKGRETFEWPKAEPIDNNKRQISFTIPEEYGEYHLKGWVNDECCIDIMYVYHNMNIKNVSEAEIKLLEELKNKVEKETKKPIQNTRNSSNSGTNNASKATNHAVKHEFNSSVDIMTNETAD